MKISIAFNEPKLEQMLISFNTNGNLHRTIGLTYEEFKHHFGTNPGRLEKIESALQFFKIFRSCGCRTVYIGGSFVSKKRNPEDIDLCFDISGINDDLKEKFPGFFDPNEVGKIHGNHKCHIFHFDEEDRTFLDLLQEDRNGNPRGLIKLALTKIE